MGLEVDVWDSKTKQLANDVLQKPIFIETGFRMILGSDFHDFGLHQMAFQLIQKVQTYILTDASVDDGFHSPYILSIFGLNDMFETVPSSTL